MKIRKAKPTDTPIIDALALDMDLDSNDTFFDQFIVVEDNEQIVGFGRLIMRENALELGTIGVIEAYRGKGVGKLIVEHLINDVKQDLYITTLIPKFFEQFGFVALETSPPSSMIRKKEWCDGCHQVGCTVMKRALKQNPKSQ